MSIIAVNAQVDCAVTNKILVRDYDGNIVENAKIDVLKADKGFKRTFVFSPQKTDDSVFLIKSFTGKLLTGTEQYFGVKGNYRLKVTAENFKETERKIEFKRCESQVITVILERIKQNIKLTGILYDENGAVIPSIKVIATNKRNELFETESLEDGTYKLKLFPDNYKIEFGGNVFIKFVIEDFKLVNSYKGIIRRDIILKPRDLEPCGYAGDCPSTIKEIYQIVESQKEFSNIIRTKNLEEINNKKIRGKIINNE
jgi:hypothetical protein